MKALTLTQPWGTLVAIGAKTIETREWNTSYRGELLITAAKKFPEEARHLCPMPPFSTALGMETLHTGCAVAVVTLIDTFRFGGHTEQMLRRRSEKGDIPPFEADFGDYAEGRFGFYMKDVRRLTKPIPCKGALGIWMAPPELEAAVREQLAMAACATLMTMGETRP